MNSFPPGFSPDWTPNPTAFMLGNLPIQWYGILFTIGFLFAIAFAIIKLEYWYKIPSGPFYYFIFIGIPVSILGARIWSFVIGDATKLITEGNQNFFQAFFDFRQGGLAIEGGVLLTVIAGLIYFPLILKKPRFHVKTKLNDKFYVKQVSVWVYADAIIPCVLIGQIIGRWGNFFNQEVYGPFVPPENWNQFAWLEATMPAVYRGMFIQNPVGGGPSGFYHPFFLYESFFNFWFFLLIYVGFEFIQKRKAGDLAIAYFFFYGLIRSIMEPFRASGFGFITSIVSSVLFVVLAIALFFLNHFVFSKKRNFAFWGYSWYLLRTFTGKLTYDIKNKFTKFDNKSNLINAKKPNVNPNAYNIKKISDFYRDESQLLYYNGY